MVYVIIYKGYRIQENFWIWSFMCIYNIAAEIYSLSTLEVCYSSTYSLAFLKRIPNSYVYLYIYMKLPVLILL